MSSEVRLCAYADDMLTEEQNELVESAAEMLYGLIHVRYILTSKGMTAMVRGLSCTWVFFWSASSCTTFFTYRMCRCTAREMQ